MPKAMTVSTGNLQMPRLSIRVELYGATALLPIRPTVNVHAFCRTGKGLLLICFLPQEMESRTVPVFKNVEYGDSLAESTNLNLAAKYFFCKAVR